MRGLQNDFDEVSRRLSALIAALPSDDKLNSPEVIRSRLRELVAERAEVAQEIENADQFDDPSKTKEFMNERRDAQAKLQRIKQTVSELEASIHRNEMDLEELQQFVEFLEELVEKVNRDERTQAAIGGIEFTHCPACLKPLRPPQDEHHCVVCGTPLDPEDEKSRYNQIRLDLEIQIRESRQLIDGKSVARTKEVSDLRRLNREYAQELSEFSIKYDLSSAPREAFLATKNQRLGQIDREAEYLESSLERAEEIQSLSARKADLQADIQTLKDRLAALNAQAQKRRRIALTSISDYATMLLKSDLDRQAEFMNAKSVTLDFRDDAIFVDGKMNFAESSNVYLKNAAIFALFLAAGHDPQFFHPRFLLLDNIEDKGMEVERSHLFQRLIVEHATEISMPYQVIYTTSMMNPELELDDYIIGPHYTHENRSLNLLS